MYSFDYQAPTSLADALQLLTKHSRNAKALAGGTDLIDQIRHGRFQPELLVDIKKIPELNVLTHENAGLRVGGATPCYRIISDLRVQRDYTAIVDSCQIIGGIQIQSRASLGGNLCNSGPAGDSIPSLIALGGICEIASSQGTREVPVASFCTGPGANVLAPGELLVALRFPTPPPHSGSHYRRMIPRNEMDIAVVGVGAQVTLDPSGTKFQQVRLALGAVAPTPLMVQGIEDLLVGQLANEASLALAAQHARSQIRPITDMRGTAEYRTHVTGVLVQRVLQGAILRAQGQPFHYCPGH